MQSSKYLAHRLCTGCLRSYAPELEADESFVVKEDLQQQLQSMQGELTQLEADLSSRDAEAADLSRKLAHARAKLGDPAAAPPANGTAQASVPGAMRARLGKPSLDMLTILGVHCFTPPLPLQHHAL